MKCTSCKKGTLMPTRLDGLFPAHSCNHCEGHWVLIEDFVAWKQQQGASELEEGRAVVVEELEESRQALLCPISGTLMRKLRFSLYSNHHLDYSSAVGGVWLDRGEWQWLKRENLAHCLNQLVTEEWQHKLRQAQSRQHQAELYRQKFGAETYEELVRIRTWLDEQPHRAALRAYLLADDPYRN
ncbi:zf-TFIIB domain-containing protein [Shewanella sedimentimangrovi]|uniref:Zf-TFIIB domain-containing protein n=1 Tax=Shewanella sedimentimangrovi TaxID=2814293 RepID=A0ABX7R1V7_9GAMM|nr:zf-TFIIB domain-containing protein [Shewanella sedimentimangrovi]QSX37078.1 zf-TFIIB domain-containing protein [Shewanella sedimentimangrovi]